MAGQAARLSVVAVLLLTLAGGRCSAPLDVVKHRLTVRIEDAALVSTADDHEPAPACRLVADTEAWLSAASEQLYHVTNGRIRWDKITIQWPSSGLSPANCPTVSAKVVTKPSLNRWSKVDVTVRSGGHPLLGNQLPWTDQFGPCGAASLDGVHVPKSFVPSSSESRANRLKSARILVRQWIKSRYGVFDETGYHGDAQYPITASEHGAFGPSQSGANQTNSSVVLNACLVPNVLIPKASPKSITPLSHHEEALEEADDVSEADDDQQQQHEHLLLTLETEEEAPPSTDATDASDESWHQEPIEPKNARTGKSKRSALNIRRISATEIAPKRRPAQSKRAKHGGPKSSFMASLSADGLCDSEHHIRWLPTKQNVICRERSVWSVIESHSDFTGKSATRTSRNASSFDQLDAAEPYSAPRIEIVTQAVAALAKNTTRRRYVLVLDRSATSRRWSMIRRALYRWIHALPDDGETFLSVIVTAPLPDQQAAVALPWTKVTSDNRDGLVGRIPRRPHPFIKPDTDEPAPINGTSNSTHRHQIVEHHQQQQQQQQAVVSGAVQLARQMLNDERDAACCGGQLVLLTGSSLVLRPLKADGDEPLAASHAMHTIAFPSRSARVAHSGDETSDGLDLAVDDDDNETGDVEPGRGAGEGGATKTQARLVGALLQILRFDSPIIDTPTQVYEETVVSRDGSSATGSFLLDAPLGRNVRIVAHCADEADVDTIEVVSPSGRVYDLPLVADGMLHVRIPHTDEFGEWNYRLRFAQPLHGATATARSLSAGRHQMAATVEVTAQPSDGGDGAGDDGVITVRAWTSVGRRPVNASDTDVLIYAQVKRGQSPVIDAKVTALIHAPFGADDDRADNRGPFVVHLHDRGTGDPDITRADGIYSAYFTKAIPRAGHYAVTIQVTDNGRRASVPSRRPGTPPATSCCGSSMPFDQTMTLQPFRRIVSAPSFLTVDGPRGDIYPPSRITDLRVERVVNTTNEAELGWTAPGSDYDAGTAAFYQIRCYTDRSALNDPSAAILVHASLTPQPLAAGTWQRAVVAVPWPNQLFYYAVVAVDSSGLSGGISNIVPVYIEEPPPPPTTPAQTPSSLPVNEDVRSSDRRTSGSAGLTEQQLYAIAGGVAGFVLLLIVLSAAACLSRRKRNQHDEKKTGASVKIQVEPLKMGTSNANESLTSATGNQQTKEQEAGQSEPRPVYKIYVNNAYIQEEDGELKIVTPDGRVIQRGAPWFASATLPRGRSLTNLDGLEAGTSATDLHHWSLPRAKTSPHRHKVLTNGSIMPGSGSQSVINTAVSSSVVMSASQNQNQHVADGTSISSKPSVSSEDTGIEVSSDHQTDSRDSADLQMILPPPGFGPSAASGGHLHHQPLVCSAYLPMYANHSMLPPLPPSPGVSQDARVVRIPSYLNADSRSSWIAGLGEANGYGQPSSRRPLVLGGSFNAGTSSAAVLGDRTPQISPPPPSTPTSMSSGQPRRKTRHISFV